jgi:type IV pilus assembly protein PilN
MARINLLPWREELRAQQQKDFISGIAAGVLATVAVLIFVHMQIGGSIASQEERNRYLTTEIAALDVKIKEIKTLEALKAKLLARMDVIQSLQGSRPEIVHLFDEIAKTVPEGVYINKFVQSGKDLTLNGVAQSNARVSAYMRKLERSSWLKDPQLNVIEAKGKSSRRSTNNFTLRVKQTRPTKSGLAGGQE